MKIHLIWAQDKNSGIGENGRLPWHVSEDLKNFKKLTLNSTIIMGRKTWDSLPLRPLPTRNNIVLSSTNQVDATTYHSLDECLNAFKNKPIENIFIIGGRSIYKLFFHLADYLHISFINIKNDNINEFFPIDIETIKTKFKKISEKELSENAIYTYWEKSND
jgi:dihydrofolate reductase